VDRPAVIWQKGRAQAHVSCYLLQQMQGCASTVFAARCLVALCVLYPARALGIPVFARIYDKPCGTCHTVFPQLNPQGESFRAYGMHGLPPARRT